MGSSCVVYFNGLRVAVWRLGLLAIFLAVTRANAADTRWRNPDGGTFSIGGNWNNGIPGASDVAHFGLSTTGIFGALPPYTVSFTADATNQALNVEDDSVIFDLNGHVYTTTASVPMQLGTVSNGAGRLTVTDGIVILPFQSDFQIATVSGRVGSLLVTTGGLMIGSPDLFVGLNGNGALNINNNGDVIADAVTLGKNTGSTGTATIIGAGTSLLADKLVVGSSGIGVLNINASGRVDVGSDAWIGDLAGSNGTANVDGTNSLWDVSERLTVGNFGTGTLNISGGGRVNSTGAVVSNRDFAAGGANAGTGAVNVSGTNSRWINGGTLSVGAGAGTINISDGGYVESGDVTLGAIPGVDSSGVLNVSGAASQMLINGILGIGLIGSSSMHISGGLVQNTNAYIGSLPQGTVVLEGTSARWINLGELMVGRGGPGTLDIRAGARVESATGVIAGFSSSSGHVTIDGTDGISSWIVSGGVVVGSQGNVATLEITNGGQVQSVSGAVGSINPIDATVLVDGSNTDGFQSQWIMTGDLNINPQADSFTISNGARVENFNCNYSTLFTVSGSNSRWTNLGNLTALLSNSKLSVSGGALVESVNGTVRGMADVMGAGSRWTNSGTLDVDGGFNATLNISAGGVVQNTNGHIGRQNGGSLGTVNVSGGSQWINSGDLNVGGQQKGVLNIAAGGRVQSVNGRIGLGVLEDNGVVTVEGNGSIWTMSGRLSLTKGTLNINPGGTVNVAGDITLQLNAAVNLQGGTLSTAEIGLPILASPLNWTSGTLHVGIYHQTLTVPNGGILAPGSSVGTTQIDGDYIQQNGGTLEIELGGFASADFVNVSGTAQLGGDLQLKFLIGFVPPPSTNFIVFDSRGIFGAFSNVANGQRLVTSDGLGSFVVNYGVGSAFDPTQIVLSSFLATVLPGDYNQNGIVDAADYTRWRNNLGSGTSLPNDDTPGVGADDYTRWRTHFGQTAGSGSAANAKATVPEPTPLVMLIVSAVGMCLRCRFDPSREPQ